VSVTDDQDPTNDPGWGGLLRAVAVGLIPLYGTQTLQRRAKGDGLKTLRSLFLSFASAILEIGVVVIVLSTLGNLNRDKTGIPPGLAAAVLVVIGIVTLTAGANVARALPTTDMAKLAAAYRVRFFLRIAFSESDALVGFVAFIITGRWWMYLLGAAFTAIGFARLAPTAASLAKDQDSIDVAGSSLNLIAALRTAMPPPRR
jgi:hypothetical protein